MTLIGQALTSSGQKVNHELVLWVLFFLVPGVSLSSQDFGMTRAYSYWQCHQIPWKGLLHPDQIEVRCWGVAQRSNRVWLACPKRCLQTLRIFELNTSMASNGPGFYVPFRWMTMARSGLLWLKIFPGLCDHRADLIMTNSVWDSPWLREFLPSTQMLKLLCTVTTDPMAES